MRETMRTEREETVRAKENLCNYFMTKYGGKYFSGNLN